MKFLPVFGLVAPPLLYLTFFVVNGSAFSGVGLSSDNMLLSVGVISVVIWVWSAGYARSANKFLTKRDKGDFKQAFGVNSTTEVFQLTLWLFADFTFGSTENLYSGLAACILLMYVGGNALRVWLTKVNFEIDQATALNANKINLLVESIIYLPTTYLILKLAGTI